MNKKGISPLIATILILGFTIALASVILAWGTNFQKKMNINQSIESNISSDIESNISLDIKSNISFEWTFEELILREDDSIPNDYRLITTYRNQCWINANLTKTCGFKTEQIYIPSDL